MWWLISFFCIFLTACFRYADNNPVNPVELPPGGSIDSSFGTDGYVLKSTSLTPSVSEYPYSMAIQDDDKIIVAGRSFGLINIDFSLTRFNADGSIDNTFGANGIVHTDFVGNYDTPYDIVLQSDGKIVVVGGQGNCWKTHLARYNTNGSLDTSFGTNGISTATVANFCFQSVQIQSDGKIVAGGWKYLGGEDYIIARFLSNGTFDTSFGNNGLIRTADVAGITSVRAIALQSNGKIIAAGYEAGASYELAVMRINANGSLDTTFGTSGMVISNVMPGNEFLLDLSIESDDSIIGAGYGCDLAYIDCQSLIIKYNANGVVDTSFGVNGLSQNNISIYDDGLMSIERQADGKIVGIGYSCNSDYSVCSALVSRFHSSGELDEEFGTAGSFLQNWSGLDDWGIAIGIQSSGKIIVSSGISNSSAGYKTGLFRLHP